jgi:Fe2+ transport system protein FeoA
MSKKDSAIALSKTAVGKTYRLVSLAGGQSFRERISAMGLSSGVRFRIVANSGHGPVGLEVRNTKLGIGRGMADKIMVEEIEAS